MDAPRHKRNPWLSLLLVLKLLLSFATTVRYLGQPGRLAAVQSVHPWLYLSLILASSADFVFTVALIRWKKWGFYGFCVLAVYVACLNLSLHVKATAVIEGILGPVLLYGALQLGPEGEKGWPQLE